MLPQLCLHNLVLGGLLIYVVLGAQRAGFPTVLIGVLLAAQAAGALAGSLVADRIIARCGPGRTILLTGASWTVLVPTVVLTGSSPVVLIPLTLLWALVPSQRVARSSYQLRTTPDALQGRTAAALALIAGLFAPIGPLCGGLAL